MQYKYKSRSSIFHFSRWLKELKIHDSFELVISKDIDGGVYLNSFNLNIISINLNNIIKDNTMLVIFYIYSVKNKIHKNLN